MSWRRGSTASPDVLAAEVVVFAVTVVVVEAVVVGLAARLLAALHATSKHTDRQTPVNSTN